MIGVVSAVPPVSQPRQFTSTFEVALMLANFAIGHTADANCDVKILVSGAQIRSYTAVSREHVNRCPTCSWRARAIIAYTCDVGRKQFDVRDIATDPRGADALSLIVHTVVTELPRLSRGDRVALTGPPFVVPLQTSVDAPPYRRLRQWLQVDVRAREILGIPDRPPRYSDTAPQKTS
ncbi:MAG: hypothetical protein JSV86_16835 [Gemmatimonadota bacterium]|nr:MAG: hypothetical protein JSV86_16835 [Gemmatimonadota bacterium]